MTYGPLETNVSCFFTATGCIIALIGFVVVCGAFIKGVVWSFDTLMGWLL